jgi:hypothetical protein
MAREGHEHRTKHRQDVGGSSTHAPTAKNKQLAKRQRPSSLCEESSPEASPPRGGTPESPNEVDCLKMRPLVIRPAQAGLVWPGMHQTSAVRTGHVWSWIVLRPNFIILWKSKELR